MKTNFTFSILKPDIVKAKQIGEVITVIEHSGFMLKDLKMFQWDVHEAAQFYAALQARPFFQELCQYMSSSPIIAMLLEKDRAVVDFRTLIGATNPAEAAPGAIRQRFGRSITANAIHGSDSDETARIETRFLFPSIEI